MTINFSNKAIKYGLYFICILTIAGCKPTRWVGDNEYLLQKNTLIVDNKEVDKKDMEGYIRQKSNKRVFLVVKMNLAAYNFSKRGKKQGKFKIWIERVIGEPPVIYDSTLVRKTATQLDRYLKNKAYYKNDVNTVISFRKKKAWVTYIIETGPPMLIDDVKYQVLDSSISDFIFSDTAKSFIKTNNRFTLANLKNERKRITEQLKDSGYFYFNKDYIRYIIDTSGYIADIQIEVQKEIKKDSIGNHFRTNHKKYWVNNIYFYPDFDPQKSIRNKKTYLNSFDTTVYKGYNFLYPQKINIKPKTILKAENLRPGEVYRLSNVNNTTKYINSLRIFRLNNISFVGDKYSDSLLNCYVQLTPFTYQNYSISFETTNTKGNVGVGGSFKYGHKNIFKGAEQLEIKFTGSNQFVSKTEDHESFNILEVSADISLDIPSFVLPFSTDRFYKKYNPKTSFSISSNYQLRPDFDRRIYSVSMGYKWSATEKIKHTIYPIDLSTVKVFGTEDFYNEIKGTYLENNYKDYFIAGGRYSMIYQNNTDNTKRNSIFCKLDAEIAGNLLFLFDNIVPSKDTVGTGYFSIFGMHYAQFAKTSFDFRFYQKTGQNHTMVYRSFTGIALPYGNANATPFIRQYSSGGADGMRAWQIKELGPGSYSTPDSITNSYPNQTADIKLELNMEYRYDITKNFKGAAFIDIGNIWSITEEDERPDAVFRFDKFYKQFAIGSGIGVRYDIKFAVIRLDAAIKVRDPSLNSEYSWILFNQPFTIKNINWNFAIGYPF